MELTSSLRSDVAALAPCSSRRATGSPTPRGVQLISRPVSRGDRALNKETREAISKITAAIVEATTGDNNAASGSLDFSVWAAAFATAASGLILLHGQTLAADSWLGGAAASYSLLAAQPLLFGSIIVAAIVRILINKRLSAARDLNDYYRMQDAAPESEPVPGSSNDLFLAVMEGAHLGKEVQKDLQTEYGRVQKLDARYKLVITCQLLLIGISYAILLIVGIRIPK